ncbi:Zinc finger and SCAN domain-containing protein 5A, partial [Armadillidium nasatum]
LRLRSLSDHSIYGYCLYINNHIIGISFKTAKIDKYLKIIMEERSGPHYTDNYIPVHQEPPTSHKGMNINPSPTFLKFFESDSKKSRFEPGFKFAHHYIDERVSERSMSMIEQDERVPNVKSEQPYLDKNDMEPQMHYHRNEHPPNQEWMSKYYNKEPANIHPFQMECAPPQQQAPQPPPPPPPPAPSREENCTGEGSPKLEIDYLEDSLNPQLPDFIPQSLNHKEDSLSSEGQASGEKSKPAPEEKKPPPAKPFLCSKCEYKTNFKSNLKSHELNHSGTYKFQCSKCEYKTNFKSNLKNHELNHSLTYKFQCSDCEYKTNFKSNLKNHELSHSMTYRFQCTKCEYKTNFKNCMKNHELTHSGTKQFHCSQCEYKTNFKRCLKIHELRHANAT